MDYECFCSEFRFDGSLAALNTRINEHVRVIKLLVPHCKCFDVTSLEDVTSGITQPCVQYCFMIESQHCDDLRITKFMLRNGATADFGAFYETVKDHHSNADLVTASFAKLCLLSGCTFTEYFVKLRQEKEQGPAGQDHRAKHVHALVKDLFSQPPSLQELSIMATRKRMGSRQLWAKIDALPEGIPRHVKDLIQLKMY